MRKRVGARTGVGVGVKHFALVANFSFLCHSMSDVISTEKIDELVKNQNRPELLTFLGIEDLPWQIGDNECLRPVSASSVERFAIHKDDVPFLDKIGGGCCSGAIVRRYGKASVGVPCFSPDVAPDGNFCTLCNEIWSEHDENGFYIMDTELMPFASKFYKPAKSAVAVLWNLPFMKQMDVFYSNQIQLVKDVLDGTDAELERDWPYQSFKDVSSDLLLKSGVMHRNADKSKNPYKRDQWENDRLADYMQNMIQCWLQISAVIDTEDLAADMKKLQQTAKKVGLAAMWAVQQENPSTPVWVGPLVPADVMLAGFRAGAKSYKTMINNLASTESLDLQDFSWGPEVDLMEEWAKSVLMARRPPRKAKKYKPSSQEPPRVASKESSSPSSVRRWYAAKGTSRPGAYVHKNVADSYNRDGRGIIKMFRSLQKLRAWMNMPALRMFFESECNPAPLPDAQEQTQEEVSDGEADAVEEFYALKGCAEDGIFKSMADAIEVKNRSGGAFAVFLSREEAERYVRPDVVFVVWAGRKIGIMSKAEVIKATQKLVNAKMSGPMSQEDGMKKRKAVKASARVISEPSSAAAAPATPTKPKKKKPKTPAKKKKFFYGVAIGRVPGVYDSWAETEKQVKGIRPNKYAKFSTRKRAQEFVDKYVNPQVREEEEIEDEGVEKEYEDADDVQGKPKLDIEIPSMEKLQEAEEKGQVRVFACHTGVGTARVAMSFEDAIKGAKNAAVQVINSKSTLLDNLADAEVRLRNDTTHVRKSMADRLAEARARAGAASHPKKTPSQKTNKGQSVGAFAGLSAVGRAKETRMILHHFLGDATPIRTTTSEVPFIHELDEDMDLPDTKATFNPAANMKDLTIKDFFNAKEKAMPTWPLMDFQRFMALCRKAQRMCQASSKEGAAVNAAAIGELFDITLRTYMRMERLSELGPDNIRFKVQMYMFLQYMSTHRVLHTGAIAATVYADAVNNFVAKIPKYARTKQDGHGGAGSGTGGNKGFGGKKPPPKNGLPVSGCYLCTATDHYSNDTQFHPLLPDGSHEKLSNEKKTAILDRVDKSALSSAVKSAEKKKVQEYWSQHKL